MKKKQKPPLFFKGYQTNPQGKETPIFTTVEPAVPYEVTPSESPSLPGARLKKKNKEGN